MTHIPQCDCSECVTYRLHACLPPRAEMVAEASNAPVLTEGMKFDGDKSFFIKEITSFFLLY